MPKQIRPKHKNAGILVNACASHVPVILKLFCTYALKITCVVLTS